MYVRHSKYCGRTHTDSDDFPWRWSREFRGRWKCEKKTISECLSLYQHRVKKFFFFFHKEATYITVALCGSEVNFKMFNLLK